MAAGWSTMGLRSRRFSRYVAHAKKPRAPLVIATRSVALLSATLLAIHVACSNSRWGAPGLNDVAYVLPTRAARSQRSMRRMADSTPSEAATATPTPVAPPAGASAASTAAEGSLVDAPAPKTLTFKEVPTGDLPDPKSSEQTSKGGSRVKQFLALEPLEDDPGNQWDLDMASRSLTADEERKKFVAIFTGFLSLAAGALYIGGIYGMDNREFKDETYLSTEEVRMLGSAATQ